jgi:hypothetical protein
MGCQSVFDRGVSQNGSYSLVLVSILALFTYRLGRFQITSGVAGCVATFEVEDDRLGESSKLQEVRCCYWKLPPEEGKLYLQRNLLKILHLEKYPR